MYIFLWPIFASHSVPIVIWSTVVLSFPPLYLPARLLTLYTWWHCRSRGWAVPCLSRREHRRAQSSLWLGEVGRSSKMKRRPEVWKELLMVLKEQGGDRVEYASVHHLVDWHGMLIAVATCCLKSRIKLLVIVESENAGPNWEHTVSLNKTQDISRFEDWPFELGQELLLRPELKPKLELELELEVELEVELELELELKLEKELEPELKLKLELEKELLLKDCSAPIFCQKNIETSSVRLRTCISKMFLWNAVVSLLVVLLLLLGHNYVSQFLIWLGNFHVVLHRIFNYLCKNINLHYNMIYYWKWGIYHKSPSSIIWLWWCDPQNIEMLNPKTWLWLWYALAFWGKKLCYGSVPSNALLMFKKGKQFTDKFQT